MPRRLVFLANDANGQTSPVASIVPTGKTVQGFEEVFIGQNSWYWVRISGERGKTLKYIAAYRPSSGSAISHVAEIDSSEPYGPEGQYKINFKEKAKDVTLIPFGAAKGGATQGPRFCTWEQLQNCIDLGKILQPAAFPHDTNDS